MPPIVIQRWRSTNWNAAVLGSKLTHSAIDSANTITEVDSAMWRALRATTVSSPLDSIMKAAPTSGRKVISESSGQWLTGSPFRSLRYQVPADQRDDADQHGKSVMIDVAGLQPARLARQFQG